MVQVPTKRTGEPASAARLTSVTERTSSTSTSASAARSMARPGKRRMEPWSAKKASTTGMFSSARIRMQTSANEAAHSSRPRARGVAERLARRTCQRHAQASTIAFFPTTTANDGQLQGTEPRTPRPSPRPGGGRQGSPFIEPVARSRSGMAARRWRISSLAAGPACTVHCSSGTVRPSARAAMNERTGRPLVRSTSCTLCPSSA